jgi:hypothetical protein
LKWLARTETGSAANTVPANITVNDEPVANSSSNGEFRDVVRESFDVIGRSNGPTVNYRLDVAYDDYPYETSWSLQSLATGAVVATSGFWLICCRGLPAWFLAACTSRL